MEGGAAAELGLWTPASLSKQWPRGASLCLCCPTGLLEPRSPRCRKPHCGHSTLSLHTLRDRELQPRLLAPMFNSH